jgi:hypothetical protein
MLAPISAGPIEEVVPVAGVGVAVAGSKDQPATTVEPLGTTMLAARATDETKACAATVESNDFMR